MLFTWNQPIDLHLLCIIGEIIGLCLVAYGLSQE